MPPVSDRHTIPLHRLAAHSPLTNEHLLISESSPLCCLCLSPSVCLPAFSTVDAYKDVLVVVFLFFFLGLSVVFGLDIKVLALMPSLECLAVWPCDSLCVFEMRESDLNASLYCILSASRFFLNLQPGVHYMPLHVQSHCNLFYWVCYTGCISITPRFVQPFNGTVKNWHWKHSTLKNTSNIPKVFTLT